ncbi:MAG TPA: hypothetical protein VM432_09260 [Bdellovibrionales bacterium]|nr:hypothetical protein [Bdellovibrionales bacterium]
MQEQPSIVAWVAWINAGFLLLPGAFYATGIWLMSLRQEHSARQRSYRLDQPITGHQAHA